MRILLLTVGGTCEPLVTSIKQLEPNFIYFLCSSDQEEPQKTEGSYVLVDGEGTPCYQNGEKHPSIAVQTDLDEENYEIVKIPNIDNLAETYGVSADTIQRGRERFAGCEILADYTGGTKSMSAGLTAAALDDGEVKLFITGGERLDLNQVRSGSQRVMRCNWLPLALRRKFSTLANLFAEYDYPSCLEIIDEISHEIAPGSEKNRRLQKYFSLCQGFLAWDRFNHERAFSFMEPYAREFTEHKIFLERLMQNKSNFTEKNQNKRPGFFLVHDLLRNAERRLRQERYDDAVARVYRSVELLAQVALIENDPSIDTGNVDLSVLPEVADKYGEQGRNDESQKVQLGLFKAYELLSDLGHPLGQFMDEKKGRARNHIKIRNSSILGHGIEPVESEPAYAFFDFAVELLKAIEVQMKIKQGYSTSPQFPASIE